MMEKAKKKVKNKNTNIYKNLNKKITIKKKNESELPYAQFKKLHKARKDRCM